MSYNKKGAMGIGMIVLIVIGVLAVGGGIIWGVTQATIGPEGPSPESCSDSTGVLTVASTSALPGATAPSSPTITCGVDGGPVTTSVTSGTTTFAVGTPLQCLVSKSDFIDKSFSFNMPCGGKTLNAPLLYSTSDNPGIRIKNDDGDFMTDNVAGLTTNQTVLSAGETLTIDVEFQGTNTEGSGNGIWIIEFDNNTNANITSVTLSGATIVPIPAVHSLQETASKAVAFAIPNIEGADKKTYAMQIVLASSKILAGGVLTDWYAEQDFIDDDNTISNGVEDSDGTAKYENTGDSDWFINSA